MKIEQVRGRDFIFCDQAMHKIQRCQSFEKLMGGLLYWACQLVENTAGLGQPHAVTGGVAEALVCTATGITVAVVTLIPYNYFLARIEREAEVIEAYATRLEIALAASKE